MTGASPDGDRAGGLRPEPAAQSQPEALIPSAGNVACPSCGEHFVIDAQAMLPAQTDLTVSLTITPGQLCMAKTVAGVIENFAALQVAVGEHLGVETDVFMAGLSYENDRIDMTFRIANAAKGVVSEQGDLFAQGTPTRSAETTGSVGEADGGPVRQDAPEIKEIRHDHPR